LLTYKSIRKDFTDHYTGTYDNSVGKYVKMDRYKVDPNPNKTCSHGLHVGSLSYIDQIYNNNNNNNNNIIVSCIVNPVNVVSIPTDYNGAKMRVCEYKVSAVHKGKRK
jgi:hypothetical protein